MTTASETRPAPPVRSFLRLVTIEHSVFALPFAYLSALTAMRSRDFIDWSTLLLITIAMVGARTFAMAANRIIDREIDAANPRTAQRELVIGTVSARNAWIGAGVALVVFLASAAALGRLPLVLAPIAVVPLIVYPYAKRFTDYPHAVLALAQAVAPVGAWIAVTGHWSWHAVVLGVGVGLWIGGFDLVYACQDTESDRAQGVRSFPARWGNHAALVTARVVHVVVFALYAWFGVLEGFGPIWYAGLAATAAAFVYQHAIVGPDDLRRVNRSFFTANGFVGLALGAAGVLDLVLR
jgi:4-hydroxybenzoate polyprenyltransferase